MKEFNIDEMEIGSIHIPGRDLCSFSQEEFLQKVPNGEILWSHLELLRKCESASVKSGFHKSAKKKYTERLVYFIQRSYKVFFVFCFLLDVLASQDQSGGEATVTIDQRKC